MNVIAMNAIISTMMIACQMIVCCEMVPFRVPKKKAYWIVGSMAFLGCLVYVLTAVLGSLQLAINIQLIVFTLPSFIVFLILAKYRDGRFLFGFFFSDFLIAVVNLTSFLIVFSTPLQNNMYVNILIRCSCMALCSLLIIKLMAPRVRKMFEAEGIFWWTIGVTAIVSGLVIYFLAGYPTSIMDRPEDFLIMGIVNCLLIMVFAVLVMAIYGMHKSQENKKELTVIESELAISRLQLQQSERQYEAILETYEQIRKTRHDLRHHMMVIGGLCQNKDYGKLSEYVEAYAKALPNVPTIQYCSNFEVNILLGYYTDICRDEHIDFSCKLEFGDIGIQKPVHLCIILGNALENAIDACRLMDYPARRFVEIQGAKKDPDTIILSIRNSFDGTVLVDEKGNLVSRKTSEGHGIGLKSIRQIAEENKGWCNIAYDTDVFDMQAMLHI